MSYATRNMNGDNMGNTFVRCPVQDKKRFAENWDRIFGPKPKADNQFKLTPLQQAVVDKAEPLELGMSLPSIVKSISIGE